MPFRLLPKSTTLDDLERPIAFYSRKDASFGAHHKKMNEDRPILSTTEIRPLTLVSGDKVCTDIRRGSLERGHQTIVG